MTKLSNNDSKNNEIAQEKFRISLNSERVVSILSGLSALLLVSGFTYTFLFYKFFGVPISLYFSVSDYVGSSIEQIFVVFLVIFIAIVQVFIVLFLKLKKVGTVENQRIVKPRIYFYYFLGGWIVFITIVGLFAGGRLLQTTISFSILYTGILLLPFLLQFFDNRIRALFMLFVVFTFVACMYFIVSWKIYNVLEGESVPKLCEQVNIKFINDDLKLPCGLSVAGATETHIFIFNHNDNTMVVWSHSRLTLDMFKSPLLEKILKYSWLADRILDEEALNRLQGRKKSDGSEKNQ